MIARLRAYAYRWAERAIRDALNRLYPPERARLRNLFGRPLEFLLAALARQKNQTYHLITLSGVPAGQEKRMQVLYAAREDADWDETLHYIQHLIFTGEQPEYSPRTTCTIKELRRTLNRMSAGCDLVFLDANRTVMWQPRSGDWVITPPWVRMVFDFRPGDTWPQVKKRFRSQKENVRIVRRAGFTTRFSQSDTELEFFYERMYLPLIQSRHSDWAYLNTLKSMREWLARGELMFVTDRTGRSVAGLLILNQGPVKMMMFNGVLDAAPELIHEGVLSALYYFGIRWCFENGVSRCDFGETRPFTTDGIFRHKVRWGLEVARDPWAVNEWLFWAPEGSAQGTQWLKSQSFIEALARNNSGWSFVPPTLAEPEENEQPAASPAV